MEKTLIDKQIQFEQWLISSDLGNYLLEKEQHFYNHAVKDVFGFYAMQIGLTDVDFLHGNRIVRQWKVAPSGTVPVCCFPHQLPFASASIDLIVMPHVLDFSYAPHQVLREIHRVLAPEGRLILTGFNPLSLWGICRYIKGRQSAPWCANFFSLARLKDWFALLDLECAGGAFMAYAPPCQNRDWLRHFSFMEEAGNRWWPVAAGIYGMEAIKRQRGMRLITPKWNTLSAATELVANHGKQPSKIIKGNK